MTNSGIVIHSSVPQTPTQNMKNWPSKIQWANFNPSKIWKNTCFYLEEGKLSQFDSSENFPSSSFKSDSQWFRKPRIPSILSVLSLRKKSTL